MTRRTKMSGKDMLIWLNRHPTHKLTICIIGPEKAQLEIWNDNEPIISSRAMSIITAKNYLLKSKQLKLF